MTTMTSPKLTPNAPISTWYRIGGRADLLAEPETVEELAAAISLEQPVRIVGEGANLLVDDDGVDGIVISLKQGEFTRINIEPSSNLVVAGAGVDLRRLITLTTNHGLAGLEVLGGIPASVGGAVRMNAGGTFGQISQVLASVQTMDSNGNIRTLKPEDLDFGYRHSGLEDSIITGAVFALSPDDPETVRDRLRACMEHKKKTQPMGSPSAGCTFKNPILHADVDGIGQAGTRVSAGKIIDRAGCKAMSVGGASVSTHHANFFVTRKNATASDVRTLMDQVAERVQDRFGVVLEREVVVWERSR